VNAISWAQGRKAFPISLAVAKPEARRKPSEEKPSDHVEEAQDNH